MMPEVLILYYFMIVHVLTLFFLVEKISWFNLENLVASWSLPLLLARPEVIKKVTLTVAPLTALTIVVTATAA